MKDTFQVPGTTGEYQALNDEFDFGNIILHSAEHDYRAVLADMNYKKMKNRIREKQVRTRKMLRLLKIHS